ncbi:MAG: hypothetical protein JO250_12420 [Armatimonadetes bacterium]|nr:hypothetical protein [Armatimonadota bacterium]
MPRYPLPTGRLGFDGEMILGQSVGGANPTTVWGFPQLTYRVDKDDNIYRPQVADANSNNHLEAFGMRTGTLEFTCPLLLDRGMIAWFNAATAPATRANPFDVTVIPYNGAAARTYPFVWFRRVTISGQAAVDGRTSMVMLQAQAMILDPDNIEGVAALTAPASLGTSGAGITPFSKCTLTDGATPTPNDYKMNQFSVTLDNQARVSPTTIDPVNRISEGAVMGPQMGAFTARQNVGAANVLPAVAGHYPFTLTLPTGDATHAATLVLATSHDRSTLPLVPDDFVRNSEIYSLFSPASGSALLTATYA